MKFIFPKNFNFKSKIFGIISYKSLILNILWCTFIFCLINLFIKTLSIKICIFIILCLPLLLLSLFGFNNDDICFVIIYILKFEFSPKIYLFIKDY